MNQTHEAPAVDLRPTILAKSDQLNADDLIAGPITITITDVRLTDGPDQPVAIHWEGGEGRPFKPCKSMRRVMMRVWGEDGKAFIGQRMTLYRDDRVRFGADAVGGIRISHMSGIDRDTTMALMVTRGKRAPYTVKPLATDRRDRRPPPQKAQEPQQPQGGGDGFPGDQTRPQQQAQAGSELLTIEQRASMFEKRLREAPSVTKVNAVWNANGPLRDDLDRLEPERLATLESVRDQRLDELEAGGAAQWPSA